MRFDEKGYLLPYAVIETTLSEFEETFVQSLENREHRYRLFENYLRFVNALRKAKASSKFNFSMDTTFVKVNTLVREIKDTEAMIQLHKGKQNQVDALMLQQFQQRQQSLAKELLLLLLQSDLSLKNVEPTISSILTYLKQFDKEELIPNQLLENLSEASKALVA